jgi:predicted ATPase
MAKIEGFRVKNFRVLQDVTLGKLWNTPGKKPLTPMTAVIGKNGVGKSTLFDAFGFLADCLKSGVEEACDLRGRGGFEKIRSQGQPDPIEFAVYYKEDRNARPITYELVIDQDDSGRPYVKRERLRQRRKGQTKGWPFSFLILNEGQGIAWKNDGKQIDEGKEQLDLPNLIESLKTPGQVEESAQAEVVELEDKRKLGIATLGALRQHPRISAFRRFIEGWYLEERRERENQFKRIVLRLSFCSLSTFKNIAEKLPGIGTIHTHRENYSNNLYLLFQDQGFSAPFTQMQMSDGTLKVFAYLLLLEDPMPPPFICLEEPENGLYHKLLETLAREFREHATGKKSGSQVFITTHQPYLVDALEPEEVWVLEKAENGYATIRRASEDPLVRNMVDAGLPLGGLWYSDYMDNRAL